MEGYYNKLQNQACYNNGVKRLEYRDTRSNDIKNMLRDCRSTTMSQRPQPG